MTYEQYLGREDLREKLYAPGIAKLVLGRTVVLFTKEYLRQHTKLWGLFNHYEKCWQHEGIGFFAPSTPSVEDFINNVEDDVSMIVAPNGIGKTASALVKTILQVIPTNPDWPIFKEYGLKWKEWEGPKSWAFLSYKWGTFKRVIWPELRKWLPEAELGPYGKLFTKRTRKSPAWERAPSVPLKCGSELVFYVYEQDPDVFEGAAHDGATWDEQGRELVFNGLAERVRRRNGVHFFALTPHPVKGRPDTGGGSWIHKMCTGEQKKGHSIAQYHVSVEDIPDWIFPEDEKKKSYIQWVKDPHDKGLLKTEREGKARYYGEWATSTGLVYDDWDRKTHVIDPFDIPDDWTRYRAIDHGKVNPTACLWAAVDKELNVFLYREYYHAGLGVYENVRRIIEYSGNKVKQLPDIEKGFQIFRRYEEEYFHEAYKTSVLDSRSFALDPGQGVSLGQLYKFAGIRVRAAGGKHSDNRIPLVEEYLRPSEERTHIVTGNTPAPKMYVFRTLRNFIREIEHYVNEVYEGKTAEGKNEKEKPRKFNDHLMNALEYLCQEKLRYFGEKYNEGIRHYYYKEAARQPLSSITGY